MKRLLMLFILSGLLLLGQTNAIQACSVITTSTEETTWFGYNEDRPFEDLDQTTYIRFHEKKAESYSYMEVTVEEANFLSIRVGINEKGVALSGSAVPLKQMNAHPEKEYSWRYHSLFRLILEQSSNITEAMQIINNFDFEPEMSYQVHIADSFGNAIVLSPGANGEIMITYKQGNYFISTNANRAEVETGLEDDRTNLAISKLQNSKDLDKENLKNTLELIHAENEVAYTFYSTIFDLTKKMVFFYFLSDYKVEKTFNLTSEWSLGDHSYLLMNLFDNSSEKLDQVKIQHEQAQSNLKFYENILLISRVIGLFLVLIILGNFGISLKKTIKSDRSQKIILEKNLKSVLLHGLIILFILFNASYLPTILLTDFITRTIQSNIVDYNLIVYLLLSFSMILLLVNKLFNKYRTNLI